MREKRPLGDGVDEIGLEAAVNEVLELLDLLMAEADLVHRRNSPRPSLRRGSIARVLGGW